MEHPENSEEYKGLVVNKGIEQPSSVNPYLKRKPKKRQPTVAEFVAGKYNDPQSGSDLGGKREARTSGYSPGSDRKMSAIFRKLHSGRD